MGKRPAADGDKMRMEFPGRKDKIFDQPVVIPEDRILLRQSGNKDQAVHIVPARLIVCVIGGIAAGCIVHDHQSAQLVESGTHTEIIG